MGKSKVLLYRFAVFALVVVGAMLLMTVCPLLSAQEATSSGPTIYFYCGLALIAAGVIIYFKKMPESKLQPIRSNKNTMMVDFK